MLLAACCVAVALIGRVASSFVPKTAAPQPDLKINWNPFSETWRNLALARQDRTVFLSLLGISWLWFVGATFLTSFFNFAKDVLSANPDVVTVLLGTFSIGIGIGSLMCEKLSKRRVEIGLVPLGSIGISVFAIDLFFASHGIAPAGHLLGVGEFLRMARALAHPGRPVPARHVRRLLQRAALRADPDAQPADAPRAHHRREQYPQLVFHDRVGADGGRPDVGGRRHSRAVSHHGVAEYRGGGLYLFARARVPAALSRVDSRAYVLPDQARECRAHSRARARPCWCAIT